MAYNNGANFRLGGALNVAALQEALDELVRRHEVLRTTYTLADSGTAVQLIHPGGALPMPVEDVPGATPEEREAELVRRCQAHAALPFNLEKGPVVRAKLLRLGAEEHVLSLILHHAVSDAWCNMVLARELTVLYACYGAGLSSPLPPLPVQYADYAVWQRQHLEGAVLEEQLHWWKDQLTGVPALELPTDRPRPAVQSFAGDLYRFDWPRELSDPLLALGRREGATAFMVMMALFQTLLGRYSGQEDFAIGAPIASRSRPEVEGLIGCFLNTLAFRTRLSGAPSFRELLARVRQQALGAYARQDAPFERVMDLIQVPRDLSRTPVFQVILNVLNTPEPTASPHSLQLSQVDVPTHSAKFDLGLEMWEHRAGMSLRFEYSTSLFDRATVERMAEHLAVLARAVVASPDLALPHLPLLTDSEREQVLVEWNATASDYPRDACIHHLFEQQASLRPDSVAVEFGEQRLTYAQLDTRANQLAHLLRLHGVGPDALVAVCLERSVELIISLLAILKAGGAYLPLDSSYPAQRLDLMLEDAPPRLLITSQGLRSHLPVAESVPCLLVEELSLSALPRSRPVSGVTSRHLAYVDFTSGSTGRPKGVAVEHRGVMRLLHGARYAHLGPEETFLLIAPLSFDASTLELWGPLLFGGRLVVFPPQSPSDLELLSTVLTRHGVTTLHLTAGLFSQVVDLKPESLRGVRQLLTGGDVVSAPHVRRVVEGMFIPVTACYGPTESTLFTSTYRMTDAAQVGSAIPIGTPIANTQVYVLDGHLQPVPVGIPGELFIGGDGLARGYLSRPDLTAERFVPNPFSATPGERLYRTGDRSRWRSDGVLEFLGRIDNQVKVRGYRIELVEVEAALLAHPDVRKAVAVVRQDSPGDKRLVVYVTGDTGPLESTELRAWVQQRLPEYMVPSAVVHLDVLPLTTNGKLDRKALPVPDVTLAHGGRHLGPRMPAQAHVAPRDALELVLARTWEQVLGVQPVGVRASFFELGGHSLLAMRLVAAVREATGRQLPLAALFQAPTVEQLATLLRAGGMETSSPLVPFGTTRTGGSAPFFCVHPVGGNVLVYAELARLLGPDQPFYGLQARGLDGGAPPAESVEEMAAEYVKAIRSVQPSGPYRLGGWSMGGVIAYEMARQLRAEGELVALLALIDAYVPAVSVAREPEPDRLQLALLFARELLGSSLAGLEPDAMGDQRFLRADSPVAAESLVGMGPDPRRERRLQRAELPQGSELLAGLESEARLEQRGPESLADLKPDAMLERLFQLATRVGALPPGTDTGHVRALFRVFESNLRAARRYEAPATESRVVLFKASDGPEGLPDDGGWSALVGNLLERHLLPGDHSSLLRAPGVRELAERLREALKHAR
ncbi:non-ribosomal peptide synthetase [Pyxidicoccus sp. 3LFB2]